VIGSAADLVGAGIITSLSRPGGNVTGINDQTTDLSAKEVEILRDALPRMKRVAVLWNRANPGAVMTSKAIRAAARDAGLQVVSLEVQRPDELDAALDKAVKERAEAIIVTHDTMTVGNRGRIADLALARRLPTISASSLFAEAGGLMHYGPDLPQMFRRAATFVDKILKGAKPADLPVEQPTKFQLVINLRTAKALGLTVSQSLLLRADHVIE
jgi:putative ABC transport system substrate-binding protein